MGQYKFMLSVEPQIGFMIHFEKGWCFKIEVFCFVFYFGLTKSASGVMIFGKEN